MTEFCVSDFLDMVYEDITGKFVSPLEFAGDQWEAYKAGRKKEIKCLPRLDYLEENYQEELHYSLLESKKPGGESTVVIEKYRVDRIRRLPLCVYVLRPGEWNGKAILYLNGHDPRGARGAFAEDDTGKETLGMAMASLGYLVLVPELFAFGEAKRRDASEETDACTSCSMLESHLLNCGLSLAGLRVFEAMKTLDFAEAAFGVHAFGAYGISGGGHVCNYTGVLEDRVEAVMLSGYPNLYKYSILAMDHCICNYVPGQLEAGESHQVTALAAPKKLLAMNGRKDPIFPLQGSLEAFQYLDSVYERLGVPERCTHILFEGGHEVSVGDVCRWLKMNY